MELPLRKTILIYCGIILCLLNVAVPCSGSKLIRRRSTKPIENVQSQTVLQQSNDEPKHNVRKRLILDNDADDIEQDNFPDHDYEVYQGVVGRPGIDFPVLKRIPSTAFNCRKYGSGYFADIETDCQVFHICEGGKKISFLCPNGTIFQQSDKICDWWFKVNCAASPSYYEDSAEFLAHNPQHRITYAQRLQNGFKVDSSSSQYDSVGEQQRIRNEQQQRERQRQHNINNQYDIEQRHTKQSNRNDGKLRESSRHQTVSNRQQQQQQKLTTNFEKPINILDDDDSDELVAKMSSNSKSNENYDFEDISSSLPVKSNSKTTATSSPSSSSSSSSSSIRNQQNGIKNNLKETNFINNRSTKDISKSVGIASGSSSSSISDDETLENAASGSFINNRNDLKELNADFRKRFGLSDNSKSNGKHDDGYSFATPSTLTASSASSTSSISSSSTASAKNRNNQRNNRISYFGPDNTNEELTLTDKTKNNVLSQQSQTNVARPTTTSNKNARRGTATYRNTQLLNSQNSADDQFESQRVRQQNRKEQTRNKEQIRKDQYDNQLFGSSSYTTPNSIGSDKKNHRRTQEIHSTTTPFYTPTIPAIIKNRYDTQFNNNNERISFQKRPAVTTESTATYATKSAENTLSEHAFEMMKTLRKLNLDESAESKDFERLIKDQRIGLNIPASSGPDTLHSLALYFATAIDNDLTKDEDLAGPKTTASSKTTTTTTSTASTTTLTTTNHTPIEILELGKNITEISASGHLSNATLRKYEKLFGLDDDRSTTTESLAEIFQREQAAFNEKNLHGKQNNNRGRPQNVQSRFLNENVDASLQSAEDLSVAHSTNPMSADGLGTTQVRQLASVFTHALSAYLHDPAKFREALSEIRPTEPTPIQSKNSIANGDDDDDTKKLTTINFLTNRLGRTEDFHKGTGPTYLPTKSTPTYRQLSTTPGGITTENLEVLDFSDVSQSTTATINNKPDQFTTLSTINNGHNTRKSIFDEVTTISTASKLKTQNIKSADRVPASRLLTESRFGATGSGGAGRDANNLNQYTTTQKSSAEDGDDDSELISTTTTNPLAYEINSGLIVSTSFPYFQDDIDGGGSSLETLNHKSFDDTNYFPVDSSSGERRFEFEQNKNKNNKPYGHNVKPLNSKPINSGSYTTTTIQTPTVTNAINSRFNLGDHGSGGGGGRQTTTDDSIATTTQSAASLAFDLLPPGNFKIKSQKSIDIDNDLQRAQSQSIFGSKKTNDGVGDKGSKQSTSFGGGVGSFRNSIIKQTANEQQQQQNKYGPSTVYFSSEDGASTTVQSNIPDSSTISSSINGHYITKTFPYTTKTPTTTNSGQNGQNTFGGRGTAKYNIQHTTTAAAPTTITPSSRTDSSTNSNWSTIGYTTLLDPYTINDGLMKGVRVTAGSTRNSYNSDSEEGKTTTENFNGFTTPSYQTQSSGGSPTKKISYSFSSLGGSGGGVTGRNTGSSSGFFQTTAQPNSIEIGNRFSSFGNTNNKNTNYDRFGKSIVSASTLTAGSTTIIPPSINNRLSVSASKSSSSSSSSSSAYHGKNTDDFENTYNNAMQQKANHIFGSLNDTSADHLMNVMKKADDNRNVRRLILLLIQTCDDDFNRTIEESRQALLNALIDMDITEDNDRDGEIRIIRTKSKPSRRGKSIGGSQQPIYNRIQKLNGGDDDDEDFEDYIKSTSTELPITTYKRPLINKLRQQTTTIFPEFQTTTTTDNSPTTTDGEYHKIPFHIKVNSDEEFNIDIVEERFDGASSKEIFDSTTTTTTTSKGTTIDPFEFESIHESTTLPAINSADTTTQSSTFDTTTHNEQSQSQQQQQLTLENAIRNVPNKIITTSTSTSSVSTYRRVAKHLDDYLGQTANDNSEVSVQHKTSDARALELLKSLYSLAGRFGKR